MLALYLGDNSKKHWYGSGKTERKMIKGEFTSQLPQRAILWEGTPEAVQSTLRIIPTTRQEAGACIPCLVHHWSELLPEH